jgi:Pregnancy-associated plasma protein-A
MKINRLRSGWSRYATAIFSLSILSALLLLAGLPAVFSVNPLVTGAQRQDGRTCGTDAVHARLLKDNPEYKMKQIELENQRRDYLENRDRTGSGARSEIVTIPVVVHVVYRTAAQNISDAQIQSQIDILNEDYRRLNSDAGMVPAEFAGLAADARIQFQLALRDPDCNATSGITRTETSNTSFDASTDDIKFTATGGHDAWPRDKYLNIWVGGNIIDPSVGALLGYAQFPGGPAATDGVVIAFDAFGDTGTAASPFDLGRTATHEIGHWLGLFHTFQGGCAGADAGTCASAGDQVCDTPQTSSPSFGCPGVTNTCVDSPVDFNSQTMNYMDYTDDACMFMFTHGQSLRMDASLFVARAEILGSDGLVPPPPGGADPDLWSQDTGNDTGAEPNTTGDPMYVSHDIWVRNTNDGLTDQQHQNPIYGSTNYIYVRVRNQSCSEDASGTLNLYWAKASSGLSWPAPWDGSVIMPALMGDPVGSQSTGSVPAGGFVILEFPWNPPNPDDYISFGADKSHFCLLSRIETPAGMTFPETGNLYENVRRNNNIVWKNITVLGSGERKGWVSVGNFGRDGAIGKLVFGATPEREKTPEIFGRGIVTVDLGPELYALWGAGGSIGSGIQPVGGTTLRILGPNAWIGNLKLEPLKFNTIKVEFTPQGAQGYYVLDFLVEQYALEGNVYRIVGGEKFVFKTVRRIRG